MLEKLRIMHGKSQPLHKIKPLTCTNINTVLHFLKFHKFHSAKINCQNDLRHKF